jgi:adenylyltransferase/sulfurtransferase
MTAKHGVDAHDYSRLESTVFSRERLQSTSIVVVGAGALGNEVAKNLALLGVGQVTIIDHDTVEASNLTRSIMFCGPDIAEHLRRRTPKSQLLAMRVKEVNPDVDARSVVGEVADIGLAILRRADLVLTCVDNEMARLETSWMCLRANRILVDAGLGLINYSSGQVTILPGAAGPCYLCRKGAQRRRELLQEMEGREDPCWAKSARAHEQGVVATTPLMASAIAALQVEVALRALLETPDPSKGVSWRLRLHPDPQIESASFGPSPTCPLHELESVVMTTRTVAFEDCTAAMLMDAAGIAHPTLRFDWPITIDASCRDCGSHWQPFVRRARFRKVVCPTCSGRDLVEQQVVTSIPRTSSLADLQLSAFGRTADQIFQVVGADGSVVHLELEKGTRAPNEP